MKESKTMLKEKLFFHFSCSTKSIKNNWSNIEIIINTLSKLDMLPQSKWYEEIHNILSKDMLEKNKVKLILESRKHTQKEIFESNLLIAEVSSPSIGLGMEIAAFIKSNKPVLLIEKSSNYDKESLALLNKNKLGKHIMHFLYTESINSGELKDKVFDLLKATKRKRMQIILENWMLEYLDRIKERKNLHSRTEVIKQFIIDEYSHNQ